MKKVLFALAILSFISVAQASSDDSFVIIDDNASFSEEGYNLGDDSYQYNNTSSGDSSQSTGANANQSGVTGNSIVVPCDYENPSNTAKQMQVKIVFVSQNKSQSDNSMIEARCVKGFKVVSKEPLKVEWITANSAKEAMGVAAKVKVPKVQGWIDFFKDKIESLTTTSSSSAKQEYLEYEWGCKFPTKVLAFVLADDGNSIIPYCDNKRMDGKGSSTDGYTSNTGGSTSNNNNSQLQAYQDANKLAQQQAQQSSGSSGGSSSGQSSSYNPYAYSGYDTGYSPFTNDAYTGSDDLTFSNSDFFDENFDEVDQWGGDDWGTDSYPDMYAYNDDKAGSDGMYNPLGAQDEFTYDVENANGGYLNIQDTNTAIDMLLSNEPYINTGTQYIDDWEGDGMAFELISLNEYAKSKDFNFGDMSFEEYKALYGGNLTENQWIGWRQRFLNPSDFSYDPGNWLEDENENTSEKEYSWWNPWGWIVNSTKWVKGIIVG